MRVLYHGVEMYRSTHPPTLSRRLVAIEPYDSTFPTLR